MKISFDKDEILSAIDRVAKKTMTMDLTWDWPCGVAYYGLAEAYKATGKTEYMEFLKNWVDEYIEMGLPSWNVNTCAMGHCLITLYEYTGDKKYWDIILAIMFCSTLFQATTISQSSAGQIHFLWQLS